MTRLLLLAALLALTGCERSLFPDTEQEIMAKQGKLPGRIFQTVYLGDTYGAYREAEVVTGEENTAGSAIPDATKAQLHRLSWPATPGYYYTSYHYVNEAGGSLYIIRKIPTPNPHKV